LTITIRKWHIISKDIGKGGISVLSLERRRTKEHLVDQDAKRPPVDSTGVSVALDHFWCDVFFCADE